MISDEEIVKRAQEGDSASENELLERYKGIVRAQARGYYLSGGELDDLVQEGMIGLASAISSYSSSKGATFKSFAILCIKRHIFDAIRRDCTKKNSPLFNFVSIDFFASPESEESVQSKEIEAEGANPEEIFIKEERYRSLLKDIRSNLKESDFNILEMYLEGDSYREIATRANCSTKYVDNAIQRIKKKISKLLA